MCAVLSRKASDSRTASSSSMTCTRLLGCISEILIADPRHSEAKYRAASGVWFHHDPPAMALDDGARDRQADTHAIALGRYEGLKQLLGDFRRNARAFVGNVDFHNVVLTRARCDQQFRTRGVLHRLDRIADQVQKHLLDLHLVDKDEIMFRIDPESHPDPALLRTHQRERTRLLDQFLDALDAPLAFAMRNEVAQAADDLAGAQRLR